MASKPLRPCRHVGCTALVRCGYCDKHRPKRVERRSAESRAWRGWYSLPIWMDELRPAQLLREPFCRECGRLGLRVYATDADHVTPHDGDWSRFTDADNLQSLCHSCHSRKTAREMAQKARARRR